MLSEYKLKMLRREVWVVSEWRDGCVFKRRFVGVVVAWTSDPPFKPDAHATLVSPS